LGYILGNFLQTHPVTLKVTAIVLLWLALFFFLANCERNLAKTCKNLQKNRKAFSPLYLSFSSRNIKDPIPRPWVTTPAL
jgi:hypothetical protein